MTHAPSSIVEPADVATAKDRDSAVSALFVAHHARLVMLAQMILGDWSSAEDVVQDAFASRYRRWPWLRDKGAAIGYLQASVTNGSRSRLRRLRTVRASALDHAPTYVDGLLWGWHRQKHTLIGVDPIHGATVHEYALPGFPVVPLLSDGERGLLLAAPGGETVRLDVRSGRVVARTPVVAANWVPDGTGLLWGVVGSSTLVALDQETLAMRQSYHVSDLDLLVASPDGSSLVAGDP